MDEKKEEYGYHKLEVGQKIRVFKNVYNDKTFYRFQITQKNYDGTPSKFYISLQFRKGVEIPNESDIIVHQFVENLRENKKDPYNPQHYYQINDFEIVENEERMRANALDDYRETIDENQMIEISDDFLD